MSFVNENCQRRIGFRKLLSYLILLVILLKLYSLPSVFSYLGVWRIIYATLLWV